MTSKHIEDALRELDIDLDGVTGSTNLCNDLGVDSQEIIELITLIENKLSLRLPDKFFNKSMSIADANKKLEDYLHSNLRK